MATERRERRIKENGINYSAEYVNGKCWRLASREKEYKGEVRYIEGDMFAAAAFSIDNSDDLNLVWNLVSMDRAVENMKREITSKEKEEANII